MVKVQKPSPKTLKKDDSAKPKNVTMKNSKVNSKEQKKVIEKTIKKVGKKELVKVVKPEVAEVSNKPKKIQQKLQKPVEKSNQAVQNVEKKNPAKENKVPQLNQKQQVQKKKPSVENVEAKKPVKKEQKAAVENVEAKKQTVKKAGIVKKEQKTVVKENVESKKQTVKKATVENDGSKKLPVKKTQNQAEKKTVATQKVQDNKKNKENLKKEKDDQAEQKSKKPLFEPTGFDEEKFEEIVCLENLEKVTKALKIQVEKEVSEKKTSIFSDYRYFLNIASYKIPNCPKRMVKLNLKHSLVDPSNDDVVLIVSDLQRGAKVDYEPTIQHYEDLLREHGVENIKIMPFNQLRNEFTTFEAKRKLANTYDYFMCDGRIVSHAVGFCGKHFQKPRTTLHAVRLENPQHYRIDIERALKRTAFKQLHKGDLISIPVGNDRFTTKQVAENVKIVIEQLKTLFPGGYPNIRNIYLKIDIKGTSALPVYVSLTGAPSENVNVIGPREQRMLKLKKQANEILSNFSMSKTGEFVKLNKTQVERKQQMRDARTALLAKEDKDSESKPPAKKAKKEKPVEKVVEEEDEDDDVENDDVEEDEDDVEEDEDDVEEDEDDEDEDEDDAEEDDDDAEEDEEEDSDEE